MLSGDYVGVFSREILLFGDNIGHLFCDYIRLFIFNTSKGLSTVISGCLKFGDYFMDEISSNFGSSS